MIEVPLNASPEQIFSVVIDSTAYDVRVILNSRTGIWSISLSQDGEDIVVGVPMLGGVDIFKQYNLPISNAFVVNLENPSADPTKSNLGTTCKLIILTDEEIENAAQQAALKQKALKGQIA